jgi:hypothetical protein
MNNAGQGDRTEMNGPRKILLIDDNVHNASHFARACDKLAGQWEIIWLRVYHKPGKATVASDFPTRVKREPNIQTLEEAARRIWEEAGDELTSVLTFYDLQLGLLQGGASEKARAKLRESPITLALKALTEQKKRNVLTDVHSAGLNSREIAEVINPDLDRAVFGHFFTGRPYEKQEEFVQETLDRWNELYEIAQPIHRCPEIVDALTFYGKPWESSDGNLKDKNKKRFWEHNELQKVDSEQYQQIIAWLGDSFRNIPVEEMEVQAKVLMMWKEAEAPWPKPEDPRIRWLTVKVLRAVCEKLKIPITCESNENTKFRPPCVPIFPFLIALRAFLWEKESIDEPIKEITFDLHRGKSGITHVIALRLKQLPEKTAEGLRQKYYELDAKFDRDVEPIESSSITPRLLRLLTYARTRKITGPDKGTQGPLSYLSLFKEGTLLQGGSSVPVVNVDFDNLHVYLSWTSEYGGGLSP